MIAPRSGSRLPAWAAKKRGILREARPLRRVLRELGVRTVCEEARCPNIGECFSRPTATFMIAGARCTRRCGFCAVDTARPAPLDPGEPARIAEATRRMALRHVVVTAVARDDLADGGAAHFAATIRAVRAAAPSARIEVLTPDFKGEQAPLRTVLDAAPDVFNHNLETVARLARAVRPQASYTRSLDVLARAKRLRPLVATKSGLMVGLGETPAEVRAAMQDLRAGACDLLTIGQYLQPTRQHLPVVEYVAPAAFAEYGRIGRELGFRHVAAGPFVRSSYHAEHAFESADTPRG
ncbi:MAG: lipoyl synthase [Deltaproteobacteria bacterium]|nr:lipoyl synthase [Deltaproteobacteria bacterium]